MSKIFIDKANSYIGTKIYQQLRNDDIQEQNPNLFYCTLNQDEDSPAPQPIYRLISNRKPKQALSSLQECDTLIFDLHNSDLQQLQYYAKSLLQSSGIPKTVILISDVLVWGDTPPKAQQITANDTQQGQLLQFSRVTQVQQFQKTTVEESKHQEPPENSEQIRVNVIQQTKSLAEISLRQEIRGFPVKYKILPFEESDYSLRKALPKYQGWKSIQNIVLNLNKNQNITAYVICAGVLYGDGQQVFQSHFQAAWQGKEVFHIGTGHNFLPTIHIVDLARIIKKTLDFQPNIRYLFAIDDTQNNTQYSICHSISKIGNQQLIEVHYTQGVLMDWAQQLTLNLFMKPSKVFLQEFPIDWHCLKGIPENLFQLNQEFNLYRGLNSVKLFMAGPPAAGKTYLSKKLAENFNIIHIQIGTLCEQILNQDSQLSQRVKASVADLRQQMIDEAQAKKKKNQQIDHSKFNPRIPENMVAEMIRAKLREIQCQNRGYILDGYPRKYQQIKKLFTDEDTGEIYTQIWPTSVVHLKASNDILMNRIKNLPDHIIAGTHHNDQGMKRRLQAYREVNQKQGPPAYEFFSSNGVQILEIQASTDPFDTMKAIKDYIQRNGKIMNFREFTQKKVDEQEGNLMLQSEGFSKEIAEEQSEIPFPIKQNMEELLLVEQLKAKEKDMLQIKSQPHRHYLFEQVVPWVYQGLLEVCQTSPENPVQFLADYLEQKSRELKGSS